MKKVISLVLLVFLLGGCSTVYPWEKAHIWYCDELDLTLTFTKDSSGCITTDVTPLNWKGETYDATIGISKCSIGFIYDPEGSGAGIILVSGRWFYEDGNLILTDFDDPLFFEPYSELVFVPQDSCVE